MVDFIAIDRLFITLVCFFLFFKKEFRKKMLYKHKDNILTESIS